MSSPLSAAEFERACVCHALRRAARTVTRRYEDALRSLNLRSGQFTILASLQQPDPVPLSMLAGQLGMDRTTLTRDLAPLERRGLIVSVASDADARVRALRLTGNGQALLAEAIPLWRHAQAESERRMDGRDWNTIRRDLDRLG